MKSISRTNIAVTLLTLVVLFVLWSLVDVAPPRNMKAEAQGKIDALLGMIAVYAHEKGEPPPEEHWSRRVFDFKTRSGWEREYAEGKAVPVDPWGTPFRYRVDQERVSLESAGADRTFGTRDDISKGFTLARQETGTNNTTK